MVDLICIFIMVIHSIRVPICHHYVLFGEMSLRVFCLLIGFFLISFSLFSLLNFESSLCILVASLLLHMWFPNT